MNWILCVKLDQEVARTKSAKCLGVVIDEELKLDVTVSNSVFSVYRNDWSKALNQCTNFVLGFLYVLWS